MAVPAYGAPRVAPAPLPSARVENTAPAAAFGVPAHVDLSGAAQVFQQAVEREHLHADQTAVLAAANQLGDQNDDLLYNPESGVLTQKGTNAIKAADHAMSSWQTGVDAIASGLSNDRQKEAFDRLAQQRRAQFHETVERHVNSESERYADAQTRTAVTQALNTATAAAFDPNAQSIIDTQIDTQAAVIRDQGARKGWSAEQITAATSAAASSTHANVITALIVGGADKDARDYFTANKSELQGQDLVKATQQVHTSSIEGEGMRAADAAWTKEGPKSLNDPVKLEALEAEIRKQYSDDPAVVKAAVQEVRSRASAHNTQQIEVTASNNATVLGAFNEGASLSTLTKMPEYLALSGADQTKIKNYVVDDQYQQQQRQQAAADRKYTLARRSEDDQTRAGMARYWELSNPTVLNALSENSIVAEQPTLGRELVTQLLNAKRSLVKSAEAVHAASIDAEQFNTLAVGAGFKPYDPKLSSNDKATLGQLKNTVETEIDLAQQTKGKPLTRDEKGAIMSQILDRKVMLDEWGRDPSVVAAVVPATERGAAYVPIAQIPSGTVAEYVAFLRARGQVLAGTTDAQAISRLRGRIEKAYGAASLNGTTADVQRILLGGP